MTTASVAISSNEIRDLRRVNYNATVQAVRRVHSDLAILRVAPDAGICHFLPGQYTTLGLGYWEPRVAHVQSEDVDAVHLRKLVRRAYSFSSPILDENGRLVRPNSCGFAEFFVVLIRQGEQRPPGLTPRIFALSEGDRLHLGRKVTGRYTLDAVRLTDNVVFVATGTGEAPHNAMLAELLGRQHHGRIVTVTCAREWRDFGYLETYREVERRYQQFRYLPCTTREPENIDATLPNYEPKRYLQDYFDSGEFEEDAGMELNPKTCQVFLCGNPAMIGAPKGAHGVTLEPTPDGMVHVLQKRGFSIAEPGQPGNVHFEHYW